MSLSDGFILPPASHEDPNFPAKDWELWGGGSETLRKAKTKSPSPDEYHLLNVWCKQSSQETKFCLPLQNDTFPKIVSNPSGEEPIESICQQAKLPIGLRCNALCVLSLCGELWCTVECDSTLPLIFFVLVLVVVNMKRSNLDQTGATAASSLISPAAAATTEKTLIVFVLHSNPNTTWKHSWLEGAKMDEGDSREKLCHPGATFH